MSDTVIPNFGALLSPYIGQIPAEAVPRFLALLERGAAERYRYWAEQLPEHAEDLLVCAGAEDEIADRIEAAFMLDSSLHELLQAQLPGARDTYYGVFTPLDVWDQLRVQANAERQGAQAWRGIATRTGDPAVLDALSKCSALEEASADTLDRLVAEHASPSAG